MLFWALGVVPFKDDFWSQEVQPGNHWGTTTAREARSGDGSRSP